MDNSTKISVVMSVYNEPMDILRESVKSILNQTYDNIEVIIVIDNPEYYQAIEYLSNLDKRIVLVVNEKNEGLPYSLRKGISISTGEIIARMDSDDVAIEHRLNTELCFMLSGNYDFVAANAERISEDGQFIAGPQMIPSTYSEFVKKMRHENCIVHPTFMFTRKMYDEVGGYKDLRAAQDYEFVRNIMSHNYNIGLCKDKVLHYRIRTNSISGKNKFWQYFIADYTRYTYNKNKKFDIDYIKKCESGQKKDFHKFSKDFEEYINTRKGHFKYLFTLKLLLCSKYIRRHVFHIVMKRFIR